MKSSTNSNVSSCLRCGRWPAWLSLVALASGLACDPTVLNTLDPQPNPVTTVAGSTVAVGADGLLRSPFAKNVRVRAVNPRGTTVAATIRFEISGVRVHLLEMFVPAGDEIVSAFDEADIVSVQFRTASTTGVQSGAPLPGASPVLLSAPFDEETTLTVTVPDGGGGGGAGGGRPIADCNDNGVADAADIADGTSADCDGNTVPDECEADGDGDGAIDACDRCPLDDPDDTDGDGVCDSNDPCPLDNPDDTDGDGICDSDEGPPAPAALPPAPVITDCNGNGVSDAVDISGVTGVSDDQLFIWDGTALYVSDVTTLTSVTDIVGTPGALGTSRGFDDGRHMVIDSVGQRIFVANHSCCFPDVYDSSLTQLSVTPGVSLNEPLGVAPLPNGQILVTDEEGGLDRLNPDLSLDTGTGIGLSTPEGVAYDAVHDRIFVADEDDDGIVIFDGSTLAHIDSVSFCGSDGPYWLAVDGSSERLFALADTAHCPDFATRTGFGIHVFDLLDGGDTVAFDQTLPGSGGPNRDCYSTLAVSETADRLFALDDCSDTVDIFDTETLALLGTVPVARAGNRPLMVAAGHFNLSTSRDCNENGIPDECEIAVDTDAPGGPFFCETDCDTDCNGNGIPDACDVLDTSPAGAPKAYISTTGSDQVWVVDLDAQAVVAVIPVGDDPRGIDIAPDNTRVYVANRFDNSISVIDATTNCVAQTIDLGASDVVTADEPYDVVVSPDGSWLYVAMKNGGSSGRSDGTVVVVDLPTGDIVAEVILDGAGPPVASPEGIVITPDGQKVYVAGRRGGMYAVDVSAPTAPVSLGSVGDAGRELVVSPDGAFVYANANAVRTSDDTAFVTGEASGERGIAISADGRFLYSTDQDRFVKVVEIDRGGPVPITTFVSKIEDLSLSESYGVDLTDTGDRGVVSFRRSDAVRIFDTTTLGFVGPVIPMTFDTGVRTIVGDEPKQLVISHTARDCNDNGTLDVFELVENDCDKNLIPDDCDPDGDGDGVPDDCDLCEGFDDELDSDGEGVPDECDLCEGFDDSLDSDDDGVPDDCDNCPNRSNPDQDSAACHPTEVLCVKHDATGRGDGADWTNAFPKLQDAILATLNADGTVKEIWVAAGTYTPADPGGARDATFVLLDDVGVYGGFTGTETARDARDPAANKTILSGDLNGNDGPNFTNGDENSYHVVSAAEVGPTAILDGFTITGGVAADADVPNTPFDKGVGAGIITFNASPTINHCNIVANVSALGAGGMIAMGGAPVLTNCWFRGNGVADPAIGPGGALFAFEADLTVANCVFTANLAAAGGAIVSFANGVGSATIVNSTIVGNTALGAGGGAGIFTDDAVVTNCVLWANNPDHVVGVAAVTFSAIDDGSPGDGSVLFGGAANANIDLNPLFVDLVGSDGVFGTEDDNLRLAPGSPCIDAGYNTAVPGGITKDLDGNARFIDAETPDTGNGTPPIVDMGAYEALVGQPNGL